MLSWNDVLLSQMIEKLLEGSWVATAHWKLSALEKRRDQCVIKVVTARFRVVSTTGHNS